MRNLKHAIRYDLLMKDEEFSDELVIRDGVQQKFTDYDGKIQDMTRIDETIGYMMDIVDNN